MHKGWHLVVTALIAPVAIFGEMTVVVGGGAVAPVGPLPAPEDEQAVGPAWEGTVQVSAVAFAQAAAVVAT